ncbi:MAG: type II secretion system major pseudopilin GspG [Pseudomonadota bacterium]
MTRRNRPLQRGFTLIEIMVVVVIIALMSTVVIVNMVGNVDTAKATRVKQDIRSLDTMLTLYRLDNSKYPTTEQGLEALMRKPADPNLTNWKDGGYGKVVKDPWKRPYLYQSPGEHGDYDIVSLGADGQPGGEKADADIGNWNLDE